jgi:hypothetical protein
MVRGSDMSAVKKLLVAADGRRVYAWIHDDGTVEWAGSSARHYLAADTSAYAYTHGGDMYRLACEAHWRLQASEVMSDGR